MSAIKPLRLKPNRFHYIGAIPVYACPDHPTDQSFCIIETCPHCQREMWVSEKKRALRKINPKQNIVYCLECLAIAAHNQGYEVDLYDIGQKK